MINNDVLRRLRYALDLDDHAMIDVFALGEIEMQRDHLRDLLLKEDQEGFVELDLDLLDAFLDGLIIAKRGKQEVPAGRAPAPRVALTNNGMLRKLRIALCFKEEDMLTTLMRANFRISRGELSAFFRQKGHKNYRECGDQVVRNFLQGLAIVLRAPKN